ncbi:MAG: hypothetical protein PF569_07170 [Candidatus Woesearchaeota archaeon]|jgi:hypothetical protein|nr:hypothetical protein [Candidatus Woesearchaeota archaeon]
MKFSYLSAESRLLKLIVGKIPRDKRSMVFLREIDFIRNNPEGFYTEYQKLFPGGKLKDCAKYYAEKIITTEETVECERLFANCSDNKTLFSSRKYYQK